MTPKLLRVVPNEDWDLIIVFESSQEFRLFDSAIAREEKGYRFLAYPQYFKNLTYDADAVYWGERASLGAAYLYEKSRPISGDELRRQWLRVGYMNQAPTSEHPSHHVYEVAVRPFDDGEPFSLTESIHGGHFEMGGSREFSLEALIEHPEWKHHFELSGCEWAIRIVERGYPDQSLVVEELVGEICRRAGEDGTAQKQRGPGS